MMSQVQVLAGPPTIPSATATSANHRAGDALCHRGLRKVAALADAIPRRFRALVLVAAYAWGRWVGRSYDGPLVSGWGAIACTEDQPRSLDLNTTAAHDPSIAAASRQFVIDVDDLDRGVGFWSAALDATEEPPSERSRPIYRLPRLLDAEIRCCSAPTTTRWPRNACTWTWRPTMLRPRSVAWRRWARPAMTISKSAALTCGSCVTLGNEFCVLHRLRAVSPAPLAMDHLAVAPNPV